MTLPNQPGNLPNRPPAPVAGGAGGGSLPVQPVQPIVPDDLHHSNINGYAQYTGVAKLTADQLLYGNGTEFEHLQDTIVTIRTWLQEHLTQQGRAEEIAEARLDPSKRQSMAVELDRILIQYLAKKSLPKDFDRGIIMASVINEVLGLGPIEPLWSDTRITEVMVNGPETIYVEIDGKLQRAPGANFRDRDHLLEVCQQILMPLNRRIDQKSPLADGRLADGSRVNIAHFSVAPGGPLLTIRRFPETVWTLKDLIENGSVTPDMACELAWLVYNKASTVVVGGTGSGKLLAASTKIATPTGMTTMGALHEGDMVLDETGQPCRVTAKYSQKKPVPFRLTFSDGTTVLADEDHNWWTSTEASRRSQHQAKNRDVVRQTRPRLDDEEVREVKEWSNDFSFDSLLNFATYVRAFPQHRNMFANFLRHHGGDHEVPGKHRLPGDRVAARAYNAQRLLSHWIDYVQQVPKDQRQHRAVEEVHTTRDIYETLRCTNGHANHAVRKIPGPITVWPTKALGVDPYVMGVWLGDGCSRSSTITTVDPEVDDFVGEHFKVRRSNYKTIRAYGLVTALRPYGVVATRSVKKYGPSKFIPQDYLYADEAQRRALLAGLLDSDGTVSPNGAVQYTNSNFALIEGIRTVIHSLGFQSVLTEKRPTYQHKGEKRSGAPAWTVSFYADQDVFQLPRKRDLHRQRRCSEQAGQHSELRYIVNVEPVQSDEAFYCITVDSPNHLYLCTDAFITTHNTSLLNALSSCIPRGERVVTVEDSLELRLHPDAHVASMEARPASAAGDGEVRIRDLVKNALRMRPDRIVVGEVRDSSALDMLQAMNTGHEGSMTTVHANGADEAINRLGVLVAQGGEIPENKVQWLIGDAVDLIVLQRRYEDGSRRVQGIYEVPSMRSSSGQLKPIPLWEWEQTDTADDGKFVGDYVKRNDISEELMRARRLHKVQKFTLDDVYRMSELPENLRKSH